MRHQRLRLFFIALFVIGAALIDLPNAFRLNFHIGSFQIDRIISPPEIDVKLGALSLKKSFLPRFGLDLSGGTHLVLEADMSAVGASDRDRAFASAKDIVERRINLYGLTEPIVQTAKSGGSNRIIVEIPGVSAVDQAIELIGRTAQLNFYEEASDAAKIATPSSLAQIWPTKTSLTGKNLKRSTVVFDSQTGKPQVSLEFDTEGAKMFEEITGRSVGKTVAIMLDDQLVSAPRVNEPITGGQAVIQGSFTTEEAKQLSIALNAGALPVPLHIIEQRNVGPSLGFESIHKSVIGGSIGLLIVGAFMIVNYGFLGLVADVALVIYSLLTFALFKTIPVTLTLAGIAGFILSIGMAVDANILIFERMKEEMRWGKDKVTALKLGFDRAFPSIRDSNVSSLITCGILYYFGSGTVRGFAFTLALGIVVSLFTAVTVTRTFIRMIYR
jgi:preprotein translocase subunit SecD